MTTLTRCPLCGADSGYTLHEGSSSKWWAIHCPACGEQVSECRSGYVDPPEVLTQDADEAWNEAGRYAQGLFDRCAALEQEAQECDQLRDRMAGILTRTVNSLRGDPAADTAWSWHDLPELAADMKAKNTCKKDADGR